MPYSQRNITGYALTDSSNGIVFRGIEAYAAVARATPVTVRYQGLNVAVADNKAFRLRSQNALIITKSPPLGQVRNLIAYAFRKNPPLGQVRQMVAYAFILKAQAVIRDRTGLQAFYDMLNTNSKQNGTITLSAANLSVGVPYASTQSDKNTGVRVTVVPGVKMGYSGYCEVYYNRIQLPRLFTSVDLKISVSSATTTRALVGAINAAYGVNLVATDITDVPVPANPTGIRLTAADTSIMWAPGTYVALGSDPGA